MENNKLDFFCEKTKSFHKFSKIEIETKLDFDNLLISCPSREVICKETILNKNLNSHLENCKFWKGTYTCIGCGKFDILSEMECHVLICDQIVENCNFCNSSVKRIELPNHIEKCEYKTEKCNKCQENILFINVDKHSSKDECLYKIILDMKNSFNGN